MDEERIESLRRQALAHMDELYGVALRMTGNRQDAEDLLQDTYVKAMRGLRRHHDDDLSKPWLFRILTNAYIDRYRRRRRRPVTVTLDESLNAGGESPPGRPADEADVERWSRELRPNVERVLHESVSDEIRAAIDDLSEPLRLTVVLRDVIGFSYREIAGILDVPPGTVMSRLHRARGSLQDALRDHAVAHGFARPEAA